MLFNLPNGLTVTRCVGSPFIWLILAYEEPSWVWVMGATLVFAILGGTDFLDGFLARRWNQCTAFGEWLDPIADKILVAVTIGFLFAYHEFPVFVSVVMGLVLGREFVVIIYRERLRRVGETLPTIYAARAKTTVQMIGLGLMVNGNALDVLLLLSEYPVTVHMVGESIFIIGAVFGFHSVLQYSRTTFVILARTELSRRR